MSQSLDDIAPSFYAAKCRWPDAPNLQAHYADLAKTFEESGSSLLELCKSFLEMVCITVVKELGGTLPASSIPTTTELLGCALNTLGLRHERGASALGKIISGHNKLADGLNEARNNEGSVAHGKDGFLDAISDRHTRVYLLSTDTLISLILTAYESVEPSILHTREKHGRFKHHNDKIDAGTAIIAELDENEMLIIKIRAGTQKEGEGIELRIQTSELLYCLDREAYVDVLGVLRGVVPEDIDGEPDEVQIEPDEPEEKETLVETTTDTIVLKSTVTAQVKHLEVLTQYSGKYEDKVHPLYEYMIHSLLGGDSTQATKVQNLTYTLLNGMEDLAVVDWSTRASTRSAVRVFVKKLFSLIVIDGFGPEAVEGIVSWLAEQIVGDEA